MREIPAFKQRPFRQNAYQVLCMKKEIKYGLFFLALTACGMFFTDRFTFTPGYSTYTDTFNLYGLQAIADPALFPGDPAANIFRRMAVDPGAGDIVFISAYKALLPLAGLPWSAKIISILSALFSAFLIYRAGLRLGAGKDTAFLLAAFHTVYFLSMDSFYFGQNRTLGALFNSLLIYVLCSGKYLLVPFFVPLFYISYAYLSFSAAILALALPVMKRKELAGRGWGYFFALSASAALTLLPGTGSLSGFMRDQLEMYRYKFFSWGGAPLNLKNPVDVVLNFIFNMNEHGHLYMIFTGLLLAVILVKLLRSGCRGFGAFAGAVGPALGAALAGFALLYPFKPLFAARQLSFILPSAVSLAAGLAAAGLTGERNRKALPWLAAFLFVLLHPFYNNIKDFSRFRGLYEYLGQLPAGSLLAGDPASSIYAGVPFYAKRKVLYCRDIDIGAAATSGGEVKNRRAALLRALCSGSAAGAGRIARDYGLTHFLVEENFYSGAGARCRGAGLAGGRYPVYEAARSNPDFRLKLPEGEIFVMGTEKLSSLPE